METKRELRERIDYLKGYNEKLKQRQVLRNYSVMLQDGEKKIIRAHGFSWTDHFEGSIKPIKVTFWVYPDRTIAFFNNPVYVEELND